MAIYNVDCHAIKLLTLTYADDTRNVRNKQPNGLLRCAKQSVWRDRFLRISIWLIIVYSAPLTLQNGE